MKISRQWFLLLILIFFSCNEKKENNVLKIKTQKTEFPENEVKEIIKEFYISYISQSLDSISPKENEQKLDSIKQIFCTKSLLDSIENEFTNNELDYDPIINAQDCSSEMLKSLVIEKNPEKINSFIVMFLSYKYDSSISKLNVTIDKIHGKYKI